MLAGGATEKHELVIREKIIPVVSSRMVEIKK